MNTASPLIDPAAANAPRGMASRCGSPRRLRVLHLIHGFEVGGAEKLLLEFAAHVDPDGFDQRFAALGHDGPIGVELRAGGREAVSLGQPAGLCPRLLLRLARHIRRRQIDILHTHDDRAHIYGAAAAWLVPLRQVIHTRHGQSPRLSRRQRWLVKQLARRVDHFVCVSLDAARCTAEQGVAGRRVSTIHNGIDLSRFAWREANLRGPIVCIARLSPEKNIANLLRAFAAVGQLIPQVELQIGGDGICLVELRHLAAELRIADRVRFLGQLHDVQAVLKQAALFVLPSNSEGIPLTILEAQACGVPVIATAVGGTPEVVRDGETGRLVPSNDSAALARAIGQLWGDYPLRQTLSRAARENLELRFDIRQMVASYERLYRAAAVTDSNHSR